jgi:hypothetical protein
MGNIHPSKTKIYRAPIEVDQLALSDPELTVSL